MQFFPSDILKPYVKSYTVITIDRDLVNEVFYPSGYVDLVINISEGSATTIIDGRIRKLPQVELLGQSYAAFQAYGFKGHGCVDCQDISLCQCSLLSQPYVRVYQLCHGCLWYIFEGDL